MIKYPLQADSIKKSYQNKLVVNVDLKVKKGEVLGLVGKNGSGKTTTLNMLCGVIHPDRGTVYVQNRAHIAKHPELKKDITYLTEEKPDLDDLTVNEYLTFIAEVYQKNKHSVEDKLEQLDIIDVKDAKFMSLSKGYKQRVLFASILVADTPIMVLDEMTDGLDPAQQKQVFNIIEGLKKDKTIVMASHNMQELVNLCDRICVMENGQIIKEAKTTEIDSFDNFAELLKNTPHK
ncbi:MAG: ABC transporter ATP-binding protein [Proteobacteria bacterium]|nr:ABC transporter ATP-binding protein [Pseudomonadota bacterium]